MRGFWMMMARTRATCSSTSRRWPPGRPPAASGSPSRCGRITQDEPDPALLVPLDAFAILDDQQSWGPPLQSMRDAGLTHALGPSPRLSDPWLKALAWGPLWRLWPRLRPRSTRALRLLHQCGVDSLTGASAPRRTLVPMSGSV